jgi:hypothetical protein
MVLVLSLALVAPVSQRPGISIYALMTSPMSDRTDAIYDMITVQYIEYTATENQPLGQTVTVAIKQRTCINLSAFHQMNRCCVTPLIDDAVL